METELIQKLEDRILEVYLKAQSIWGRNFELPKISFDLTGGCAGRAYWGNKIQFNSILYRENVNTFLERTVPHEIAHLITFNLYPRAKQGHGPEWKGVMAKLGINDVTRCHSYDTSSVVARRPRTKYKYFCNCSRHIEVGNTVHIRAQENKAKYSCKKCKGPIVYSGIKLIP